MNLTFLNGVFLAGLAAAAIPVIIHLLQRRRLKRIEFSDLRFLAPLNQQRMRSMNLRRLLLLLLRVMIVAFAALAMARPSIRGGLTSLVPTQARSSVMLLVDTSYSMRAEGERGTALDDARVASYRLLQELQQGDEVNLMTFDDAPRRWFQTPVHDFDVIRERLNELEASYSTTNWPKAIEAALEELEQTTESNRELYVISDFVGVMPESITVDLARKQDDIRVTLIPVRVEPFVNVSLEEVQIPPGAILRDDPIRIGVTVRNHATDVPADCVLRVELGGEPKGEASLRLGRAAQQTQEFTLVATQAQELPGLVSKRVDRLPADDTYSFVLPVLSKLSVLHVVGDDNSGGSFFMSRALEPSRGGRSPIELQEVRASRFASGDLDGRQVVVLSSDAKLTESQAQILSSYVEEGGGLCLLTGQRETADLVNGLLSRLGDARVRGVVPRQEGFVNLVDLRPSGILAGFKQEELQALERVQFTRHSELTAGADARTVLRFAGGQPALVEGNHGSGKYMLFAFDASTDGSNLALSPMFLPLVHRSVVYLAGETGRQQMHFTVGERIEVQVPISSERRAEASPRGHWEDPDSAREVRFAQAGIPDGGTGMPQASDPEAQDAERMFTVTTPSGDKEAVLSRYVGKIAIVTYENTREPGHYVFEGLGHRLVRAVNVDSHESEVGEIEPAELLKTMGVDADELRSSAAIGQHMREARHGKELYKLIVVVVVFLMIVELMLSRVAASQRSEPSA